MSDTTSDRPAKDLVLEYDLDTPPEKVWRAIGIAEFRKRWLPDSELVDTAPVSTVPGEEVRYRLQDDEPPHLESLVTFHLSPTNGVEPRSASFTTSLMQGSRSRKPRTTIGSR